MVKRFLVALADGENRAVNANNLESATNIAFGIWGARVSWIAEKV